MYLVELIMTEGSLPPQKMDDFLEKIYAPPLEDKDIDTYMNVVSN